MSMADRQAVILGWARSPVVPVGGALSSLSIHALGRPVLEAVCQQAGVALSEVQALVLGNALGAGGNPARMLALAAGLSPSVPAWTIDSQCCAGLDAVGWAAQAIASGAADLVLAGGVEAWSQAPTRLDASTGRPYDRPAFAPNPEQDVGLMTAADQAAELLGVSERELTLWGAADHRRAAGRGGVPVPGRDGPVANDAHPRPGDPARDERWLRLPPLSERLAGPATDSLGAASSRLTRQNLMSMSPRADGAAMVLMASSAWLRGRSPGAAGFLWSGFLAQGGDPALPLWAGQRAAESLLQRHGLSAADLAAVEIHDAFAVQSWALAKDWNLPSERLNAWGGGLARGHPIGASGAVALVQLLNRMSSGSPGSGVCMISGAGGLGSAALISSL